MYDRKINGLINRVRSGNFSRGLLSLIHSNLCDRRDNGLKYDRFLDRLEKYPVWVDYNESLYNKIRYENGTSMMVKISDDEMLELLKVDLKLMVLHKLFLAKISSIKKGV